MRSYVRPNASHDSSQSLQICHAGRLFRFRLEHASIDETIRIVGHWEHAHPVYHIVLYTQGDNAFSCQGHAEPCVPGTLALTAPGESHSFSPRRSGTVVYSELTFAYVADDESPLTIPFHAMLALHGGFPVPERASPFALAPAQVAELHGMMKKAMDWLERGGMLALLRCRTMVGAIFEFLLRECYRLDDAADPSDTAAILNHIRTYIEQHFAEPLPIDALARRAGLSTGYFIRAYRRAYGLPPGGHQQRLRVEAAQTLLRTTNLRGREIAARVGFCDEYYLSPVFRRITGLPPSESRRRREPPAAGGEPEGEGNGGRISDKK